MSEQPGQGDGDTGRDTVPTTGGPAGKDGEAGDAARAGRRALWLGGGALLLTPFFFPVGMVLGIAALVVGIKARRLASKERSTAPGAVPGIVLGAIGLAFASLSLVTTAVLWPELSDRQECLSSANTTTDENACRDSFVQNVEEKLNLPKGSMDPYKDMF
ncbi:DUF4190 domain-containing protein [Actinomadura sp. 9N407]|uniref:DUF4190 domain-containing protein n=1 Tax=Actinomadura sp. 9N407 TaxID=3375154 RepID=UPI00378EAE80